MRSIEKDWSHSGRTSVTPDVIVGRLPRYGASAINLIAQESAASEVVARIVSGHPDAKQIGAEVREVIRVENGSARIGGDTGYKTIAREAQLNLAISFN